MLGIGDLGISNRSAPSSEYNQAGRQTNLNGQFVLLGSLRITDSLRAYYEGRIFQVEGLAGSQPRIQETGGWPLLQGYLRYTLKPSWNLNVQAGRFGSPFGQWLSRNYADRNPLAGFPLIYSYRTSLNSAVVPRNIEDIFYYREISPIPGSSLYGTRSSWLPLVDFAYPVGVMLSGNSTKLDYRIALVNSSISNPLTINQPGQRLQWVGGAGWAIFPGMRLGASLAEGPYLDGSTSANLPTGKSLRDYAQRALNLEFEYALHHLEAYAEFLFTDFQVPNVPHRLGAKGYYVELKHTWHPRFFTALRWNQVLFSPAAHSGYPTYAAPGPDFHSLSAEERWAYNTNSLEAGLGFRLNRSLLLKSSYQWNRTVDEEDPRDNLVSIQLVYSFDGKEFINFFRK
jgi:hypothetical protein